MPKYPEKLFESDAMNLIWGVTPGSHVAHVIDPKITENAVGIPQSERDSDKYENRQENHYESNKVSQKEAYNNAGDNQTAEMYMSLAQKAAKAYENPNIPDSYRDTLLSLKGVVTASGRQQQQKALQDFKKKAVDCFNKMGESPFKDELSQLYGNLMETARGTLDKKKYTYDKKSIQEPGDTAIGKFGIWTKSNDELFPHTPSPNDIKQGYGVQDCYVLSCLSQIAAKDPNKIKEAMRDNEDGTVTVRFFKDMGKDKPREPVYITVNKTVNKLAGCADVYSSSSLWVQMMEKAYIGYVNQVQGEENSFNSIYRGFAEDFLNAFDGEKTYMQFGCAFGFMDNKSGNLYNIDKKGNPVKGGEYVQNEERLYNFLKRHVNEKKETMIVGNSASKKENADFALDHGIRTGHAYAVMGVFTDKDSNKKYVQLRDPYALFRGKYDEKGKLVNDSAMIGGTLKGGVSNMGTFNLELKDFHRTFDSFLGMEEGSFSELFEMKQSSRWRSNDEAQDSLVTGEDLQILFGEEEPNQTEEAAPEPKKVESDLEDLEFVDIEELDKKPEPKKEEVKKEEPKKAESDVEDLDWTDIEEPEKKVEPKKEARKKTVQKKSSILKNNPRLLDMLHEPGGLERVAETVKYLNEDLEKTAMFFSYKNSKEFVAMRDKLKEMNTMFQRAKQPDEATMDNMYYGLSRLSRLATDYAETKYTSITENIKQGKEPSLRAVHRLSDAVSLMRLAEGDTNILQSENGFAESMCIIKEDMTTMARNIADNPNYANKELLSNTMANTGKILDDYIEKHPALKNQMKQVDQVQGRKPVQESPENKMTGPKMENAPKMQMK